MTPPTIPKIFIIGGTGAQGLPVVRGLVSDGKYAARVMTRNPLSHRAQELASLTQNVEIVKGTFTSEADLRAGFTGCEGAFVNLDGFTVGEMAEMFWTMRSYELAIECGIKFFVFGNLEYGYKKSGYDPRCRTGHFDAKGRMAEWLLSQHESNKSKSFYDMKVAIFTTGPYIEMVITRGGPMAPTIEDDEHGDKVVTWRVPLTADGAVVHASLGDCAYYVRWLFDHQARADGMDLKVAIEHVHYADMAKAFEKVTGRKARFIDTDFESYWRSGPLSQFADRPTGQQDSSGPGTMTIRENFTGFWNIWRASGHNNGIIQRDYKLLDEIHPQRLRTVEQYFKAEEVRARQTGGPSLWDRIVNMETVLKLHEDTDRGKT